MVNNNNNNSTNRVSGSSFMSDEEFVVIRLGRQKCQNWFILQLQWYLVVLPLLQYTLDSQTQNTLIGES